MEVITSAQKMEFQLLGRQAKLKYIIYQIYKYFQKINNTTISHVFKKCQRIKVIVIFQYNLKFSAANHFKVQFVHILKGLFRKLYFGKPKNNC